MLYSTQDLINRQAKELKKLNAEYLRFTWNGYQYRFVYDGNEEMYVRIDRRIIGARKFFFYDCISCKKEKYWDTAHEYLIDYIIRKEKQKRD